MFTKENRTNQPVQSKQADAPDANVHKLAPPPFQLKADPTQQKAEGEEEVVQQVAAPVQMFADGNAGTPVVQKQDAGTSGSDGISAEGVPAEFIEHLKLREGWRTKVYLDSRGLPTVGLGHLLTASQNEQYKVGDSVPEATLNTWATQDAKKAYDAATSQAATLGVSSQSFTIALASVNFQLGTAWNTKFKKTWAYMVAGEWEKAALECQDSAWYSQTPVRVQDFQAALRALAGTTTTTPATNTTTPAANTTAPAANTGYDFKIGAATGTGTSTGDGVNVRKGPGTTYDKTGKKLSKGAGVSIYGETNGWVCIGQGEWVSKDFISTSATGTAKPATTTAKDGPNVAEIAKNVWDAMFGGYTGMGTDEEAVYSNLSKLKRDGTLIDSFKKTYRATFGTDVVSDIKAEFSNSMFYGNQLDQALGYLNAKPTESPKVEAKAPATVKDGGSGAAKPATKSKFDIEKAVTALNTNAEPNSIGRCARYVRMAINAGGVATPSNPVSAKDYKGYLETLGFKQVSTTSYEKGDIAVFESFQGKSKFHEHGHIQMWNGTQWVSDFKQRDFWAGSDYRTYKPGHVIYRM